MRLPEIQYGGNVEGLGRYDSNAPAIIARIGEVKASSIRSASSMVAQGLQTSGQLMASATVESGKYLADAEYQAVKQRNDTTANNIAKKATMEIQNDLRTHLAWVNAGVTVASAAWKYAATSYDAAQTAKQAEAVSSYKVGMDAAATELAQSPQTDISGYDYSGWGLQSGDVVPMIGENGEQMLMVATEKVMGNIIEQKATELAQTLTEGVEGDYLDELERQLDIATAQTITSLIPVKSGFEKQALTASFTASIEKATRIGDVKQVEQIAAVAVSRGVYTETDALKVVQVARDYELFDDYYNKISTEMSTENLKGLNEQLNTADLPQTMVNNLKTDIRVRTNELKAEAKVAEREAYSRNFNQFLVSGTQEVLGKQMGEQESLVEFDKMLAANPEFAGDAVQARTYFQGQLRYADGADGRKQQQIASNWWTDAENGQIKPPPPGLEGKAAAEIDKRWKAHLNGNDVETSQNAWNELTNRMLYDRGAFLETDIDTEFGGSIDAKTRAGFKEAKIKLKTGGPAAAADISDGRNLNARIEDQASSLYGRSVSRFDEKQLKVLNGARYLIDAQMKQATIAKGGALTQADEDDIIDNVMWDQHKIVTGENVWGNAAYDDFTIQDIPDRKQMKMVVDQMVIDNATARTSGGVVSGFTLDEVAEKWNQMNKQGAFKYKTSREGQ